MRNNMNIACTLKSFGILLICMITLFVFMAYAEDNNPATPSGPSPAAADNENGAVTHDQDLDYFLINNDVYEKDRKGPVPFEHRKHAMGYGISCWDCHHEYVEGENTWSPWNGTMKCLDCHDPYEENGTIPKLQTAYHVNCKNCHKENRVFGDDAQVYRKCTTCHQRQ